jgi:DNA-binding CsgD family transcriptional regulator/PAS domain-containing protein
MIKVDQVVLGSRIDYGAKGRSVWRAIRAVKPTSGGDFQEVGGIGVADSEGNLSHTALPRDASTGASRDKHRASTQKLPQAVSTLIEARTGDAVYVVGPDYTIVHWDERMESLSGVLSKDALGKRCYEAVMGVSEGGEPFCAHGCAVMHLAQEGRPVSSFEMRIRTRAGIRRWVSASNLTIETDEGPYLVHLLRDAQGTHDALEMARGLIQLSSKEDAPAPRRRDVPALTPRQLEVLKLLSEGRSVREIGKELYLSEATVRNHVRSLLLALDAHSQLDALAKAREAGLL